MFLKGRKNRAGVGRIGQFDAFRPDQLRHRLTERPRKKKTIFVAFVLTKKRWTGCQRRLITPPVPVTAATMRKLRRRTRLLRSSRATNDTHKTWPPSRINAISGSANFPRGHIAALTLFKLAALLHRLHLHRVDAGTK